MKTISIVVPVFNEEDNIEHFYESVCKVMESLPYDFELIYVDDGSKDRSREILHGLEKQDERRRSRAGKAGKAETGQPADRGRKTPSETSYGGERAGSVPVINMSLAQAIVSAEVLGRPKALQRRRR